MRKYLKVGWEDLKTKDGREISIKPAYVENGKVYFGIVGLRCGIEDENFVRGLKKLFEGDNLYKFEYILKEGVKAK